MVENRKLFYAISLMLLTCCQIITMLPHNVANSESNSNITTKTTNLNSRRENKNAKIQLQETKSNKSNNNDGSDFLIIVAERIQQKQQYDPIVSGEGVWEIQENDSTPTDNIDDLIFLDKRPINQQHKQHEKQQHYHLQQQELVRTNEQKHFKFHHITLNGGGDGNNNTDSNEDDTDSLADTTYTSMIVVDDDDDDDDNDNDDDVENIADDAVPHEIELQPDINEEVTPLNVTPLDLSDFLSLIPATKVKTIVNHYYHNDPEVQRAHAFMSSRDFLMLKQHIISVPEMSAFLHYLNNSGLDLVKFVTTLTNLTSYENKNTNTNTVKAINFTSELGSAALVTTTTEIDHNITNIPEANDIVDTKIQNEQIITTISNIEMQTTADWQATTETTIDVVIDTTTVKEQLNGLHGLVDSVLDVLPQDQILATFFDKLEANEQFSKLVDNIGSPEFAKILTNMQNSLPLRNLIFTLHNNGIYVIRIVDSLKSYFFLGGF